ncbi:hypothetical protein GBAR_LOCUS4672 [Geodia barretti]|uniref:Uncharacterized protein n=1 Tax=Geodia barretti TaxID=519541 RepID=A0AA35WAQ8_GEOBA|nr:hypothetical protein GBAR_LOCUS4672 [Geodia barretti]
MKESLQNIGDLIAEPSAAFSRLKLQPRSGIAFIVFYLFSVLIGWAVLPYTKVLSAAQLVKRGLQPEQLESAGNIGQIFESIGIFIGPIFAIVVFVIISAVFKLAARFLVEGVIALLVGEAIVDWLMPLPSAVRIALLAIGVGVIGYLLYKYLVQPLRASLTLRDVALNVEGNHPNLEDRLVSAIEFGNRESADPIEAHMLQRLLEDTIERVKGINFKATIDHSRTQIHTSLLRVLVPWERTDPILTTKLAVEPGNARILRGKSLPIHVTVTERYTVEVFEMPKVTEISVAYTYPDYTGLKPVVQTGTGNIHAVVGTQAEIRLTTNKAIQTASIATSSQPSAVGQEPSGTDENVRNSDNDLPRADNQRFPIAINGNTLTTTIDVVENGSYAIQLLCIDGFNNEIPIEYTIKAIPDAVPEVVIKEPGRDVKVTKLDEVEIIAEATDDYGVAELKLMYRVGSDALQELVMESCRFHSDCRIRIRC